MTKRRYPNARKAAAVILAEQTSVTAAAEAMEIPATTLDYWMRQPQFVAIRERAHEDMADENIVAARYGLGILVQRMPDMESKDLIDAVELAARNAALLSGGATSRTETRTVTDGLNDHEAAALRELLHSAIEEAAAVIADGAPS